MVELQILRRLARGLPSAKVLCVGDIMLDRFIHGAVERISPEGPIPVLLVKHEVEMLGGVGNVAANLSALGAKAGLYSVVGSDDAGRRIETLLESLEGCRPLLLIDPNRPSTVKTRCVSQRQQMLRIDREVSTPLNEEQIDELVTRMRANFAHYDVLLISDYKKGVLAQRVISELIVHAKQQGLAVLADPKGTDYSLYIGATVITPNRAELAAATGLPTVTDAQVETACGALIEKFGFESVLATRSEDGMSLVTRDGASEHIKPMAREVFDVAGAGDTVIAIMAAALATGATLFECASLANLAAGIVVGKFGTATTSVDELLSELRDTESKRFEDKIVDLDSAMRILEDWRRAKLSIGFTNGCFDLLHPGHVTILATAKAQCDRLIVGLNSDASIARLKGAGRPLQGELARATVLASLASTDLIVPFEEDTPLMLLERLRPDLLLKGADYKIDEVVGAELVRSYGGNVKLLDLVPGHSTTSLVRKMQQSGH